MSNNGKKQNENEINKIEKNNYEKAVAEVCRWGQGTLRSKIEDKLTEKKIVPRQCP